MTILQLNPPIPVVVKISKHGIYEPALAHALIDYGIEHNLYWVVFLQSTGECWTMQNSSIRAQFNVSVGRVHSLSVASLDIA